MITVMCSRLAKYCQHWLVRILFVIPAQNWSRPHDSYARCLQLARTHRFHLT